jgi:hypothetical protein
VYWEKTYQTDTMVVSTHGIIKKSDKKPKRDIEKADILIKLYFDNK